MRVGKPRTQELKRPATTDEKVGGFFQRLSLRMSRLELWGHKAANKVHRVFISGILVFISYYTFRFLYDYNEYWKLRRVSHTR